MLVGIVLSTVSAQPAGFGQWSALPPKTAPDCRSQAKRRRDSADESCAKVAASYARFSSSQQNESSLTDQQRTCRERAERDGFRIDPAFEFEDSAVSGTKLRRTGLDELLEAAKAGRFHVLYFHSLSRLARESVISMPLLKELVYVHRIRVISVTEGVDSDTDGWDMLATMFSIQHERYLKELAANVHRGQVGTVQARFSAGDYRFGYNSVPSPGGETTGRGRNSKPKMVYVICEEQAEWVRRIFHWFVVERQPLSWIVRELTRSNVPKDHRSSTKSWHRTLVIRILRSPKYIGLWSWGLLKNHRNPLTGKVHQEERSEEETSRWVREFPELRIIEDETYDAAQKLLDESEEQCSRFRKKTGQLCGSGKGSRGQHLLGNLIQCRSCGKYLYVGGANGKYLCCPGARDGICNCKTQLPRALAEKLILNAIGERILANPIWSEAIYEFVLKSWKQNLASRPDEENELRKQIEVCDRRIEHLVDEIESSEEPDPGLRRRLQERRAERSALAVRDRQLQKPPEALQTEPTREWSDQQLMKLGEVLRSATPAAGEALRNILVGPIVLEQIPVEGRKRCFWRGTIVLRLGKAARTVVPALSCAGVTSDESELTETITLDFRKKSKTEEQGDIAWPLSEKGMKYQDIGKHLGVSFQRVTAIMKAAAAKRGIASSDGRLREASWSKRNERMGNIQDEVMRMHREGMPDAEIAKQVGLTANTVGQIISLLWRQSPDPPQSGVT